MNIYLDEDFYAKTDSELFGYMGEKNTRLVDFTGLRLAGADSYTFIIEYGDGVKYEVPIENSCFTVTSQMLRAAGRIKCQVAAKAHYSGSEECRLIKKSNVFELVIMPSISGNIQPVPEQVMSGSLLDGIRQAVGKTDPTSPRAAEIITDVIADAIEQDISRE